MDNNVLDKTLLQDSQCIVKRTYWVHSQTKSFKRRKTEVIEKDRERGDLVFLEYTFVGPPCPVSIAPHGNAKASNTKPFIPSAPSSKEILHSKSSQSAAGPSKICDETFETQGGLQNMKAVSDMPRNRAQVKYIRSSMRERKEKDELAE